MIFRFDQSELEKALARAVERGVFVHALIAATNRTAEESLRRLELRLLNAGVTVARTAQDLLRYHGKLMIIDRRELYLLAFNLTHADMERSRSFGLVITASELVREAVRLFEADAKRIPYEPQTNKLVISPVNARQQLAAFIEKAKKELIVYDPKVSDRAMLRLLRECAASGVKVRVIGKMQRAIPAVEVRRLDMRLHTRTMVRDGEWAFLGSQSLRADELDSRREVGLIFREPKVVRSILRTFDEDWERAEQAVQNAESAQSPALKVAKKLAKAVAKELPDLTPIVNGAVKTGGPGLKIPAGQVVEIVRGAVKIAVRGAVKEVLEAVGENPSERAG